MGVAGLALVAEDAEDVGLACEAAQLAVLFVGVGVALGVVEELTEQGDGEAVAKGQTGLQDVDKILGIARVPGTDLTCREMLIPEAVAGEFLGAVDGDGIGVVDQVAAKGLGADQALQQFDVRLFEVGDIDVAQQPIQRIGVQQGLQLGKEWPQVGLELRARQLAADHAPGGELKDEHQQAVNQQDGEAMPALLGLTGSGTRPKRASSLGSSRHRRQNWPLTAVSRACCSASVVT